MSHVQHEGQTQKVSLSGNTEVPVMTRRSLESSIKKVQTGFSWPQALQIHLKNIVLDFCLNFCLVSTLSDINKDLAPVSRTSHSTFTCWPYKAYPAMQVLETVTLRWKTILKHLKCPQLILNQTFWFLGKTTHHGSHWIFVLIFPWEQGLHSSQLSHDKAHRAWEQTSLTIGSSWIKQLPPVAAALNLYHQHWR